MSTSGPHIAVLGGGLTGLSAAYHLARLHPTARVTLLEKDTRFGGWIRSERVEVQDEHGNKASVLLEAGPRTLRSNAKAVLELVLVGGKMVWRGRSTFWTSNHKPSALHGRPLPLVPGSFTFRPLQAFSSFPPLSLASSHPLLAESSFPPSFLSHSNPTTDRRTRQTSLSMPSLPDALGPRSRARSGSALCHGVYGADSRQLSVRAAFPTLWEAEERGKGSVMWGEIGPGAWFGAGKRKKVVQAKEKEEAWALSEDQEFVGRVKKAAVLSFKDGLEQLVTALVEALEKNDRVQLRKGTEVVALSQDSESKAVEIRLANGETLTATHVISALPLPALSPLLPSSHALPHLTVNPASTVTVFTLVFSTAHLTTPLHPPGFGYLIPRPADGYEAGAKGDESGLLGVVFDTASLGEQDAALEGDGADKFVKITAMIGGPYPLEPAQLELESVLKTIARQLGRDGGLPKPVHWEVHRNVGSIPTYTVGHVERMEEMRRVAAQKWDDRLVVVGAGVGGVSVGDCAKAGREAARGLIKADLVV
ncbi:hypothetical protein EW146_g8401 [Bondarzewia mesenterica]|uniref:Protoporphyrinogen oxidase n=1 Tax=Bondarzewia mesenterica TaxID=1095465 RepID=A0A4S4LFB3_9AGAM|nr:hypothetical protein EW146_g8401 [Bondarzewia mesenterica]